ncbi:hypothetical protein HQ865_23480 [Mucilaginibacter mali]|uniref:PKD family protein n=1 Tax=Mucilaginibacter mali TaxID=2740462 RepID=A0A7D4TZY0_9SPHI|nr:PKD-like family lipoprotein [Mucilaginibacter mali]QKJ32597.1 hypothetical protein HQ865_23480 [Mucilaginibacter mali]
MKLLKYGVYIALLSAVLFSCKKDLGNYTYTKLPNFYVDTVGQVKSFSLYPVTGTLTINPKIVYDGDASNLTYLWRSYGSTADTLSKEKNLNVTNLTYVPGNYTAELQVTEKSTGIRALMRYSYTLLSLRADGWLVEYETAAGGSTDVALIRHNEENLNVTTDDVQMNIFSAINGAPLTGKPVAIISNTSSPTLDAVYTDKTAATVNRPTYKVTLNFGQMFSSGAAPATPNIQAVGEIPFFGNHIVNNGDVIWMYSGLLVGKITIDNKGYYAAPFMSTLYAQNGMFYDALNMRFCYLQQQTNQGAAFAGPAAGFTPRFSLNNIGKNMLYMGLGNGILNNDTYKFAFFEDLDKSHRWLYGISPTTPNAPDYALIDISAMPNIFNAKYFALGTLGPVAFYATDNSVYNFAFSNTTSTTTTPVAGFTAPAGEVITCIKPFLAQGIGYTATTSQSNKLLYVATWNATTKAGKVYVLSTNVTSGAIGTTPLKVFSGFGKIASMAYKPL